MKDPANDFTAKVAVDDVELINCDLPVAESECSETKPFRCGNGVQNIIKSIVKDPNLENK